MMFLLDLAFAAELIALGVGAAFLVWAHRTEGVAVNLAKTAGYVITIGALLGLLCTTYYGTKYWREGYFASPIASQMMLKKHMMQHRMKMMHKMRGIQRQNRERMKKLQQPNKQ